MTDVNEEMAVQYAMARRQFPTADADRIIEVMIERMGRGGTLALAAQSLVVGPLGPSAEDMANEHVRHFVYEMEEPDADDDVE